MNRTPHILKMVGLCVHSVLIETILISDSGYFAGFGKQRATFCPKVYRSSLSTTLEIIPSSLDIENLPQHDVGILFQLLHNLCQRLETDEAIF